MTQLTDLITPCSPNFCPGCGNIAIWSAFKQACVKANWNVENTVITAGIGCHGHMLNFVRVNSFESLHGRGVPVASGVKMVNHKLNVFSFVGDGDCLGEGGNHFIHTCRRNHDQTIFLHDNAIYGLTTGQTSPRSPHGFVSKSTPDGNLDIPLNPVALAIASGATFVARGYTGKMEQLTDLMIAANDHKGTALIQILQPCVTFNKVYTAQWYFDHTYELKDEHDPSDKTQAFKLAQNWADEKIPLGLFYKEDKETYESQIPQIKDEALVAHEPVVRNLESEFAKYM